MNKKTISLFKGMISILIAIFIFSCNGKKDDTFKIGVIAPLTGDGSRYGVEGMKYGIDLAVEELNRQGGFQGKKIEAVYQDDKFSTKDALNGFNYLVDVAKVPVIFGPAGSGISKTLAPKGNERKVVLFSSISTSDTLTYAGDYFFRNISANALAAKAIANLLQNKLNFNTVGVFYENNEYGINMNRVFKQTYNGDIVFNLSYEFGQTDFRNSITPIKNKKFDAIFIQGTTKNIALITKQLRENNINCPIMTGDGGYGNEIKEIAGKSANGLYCTLPDIEDTKSTNYIAFKEIFNKAYNEEPDVYSVLSYDAVMMVFDVIKGENGKITGEIIKKLLYEKSYKGLGGEYKFDSNGDVNKDFFIFQYNDEKYTRLD
jgi:branched-chain amino acid transport system substrate-binding protein